MNFQLSLPFLRPIFASVHGPLHNKRVSRSSIRKSFVSQDLLRGCDGLNIDTMAGKVIPAQMNEAKVVTDNGPKDIFALLVSSALHSHCATLYSSARFVL